MVDDAISFALDLTIQPLQLGLCLGLRRLCLCLVRPGPLLLRPHLCLLPTHISFSGVKVGLPPARLECVARRLAERQSGDDAHGLGWRPELRPRWKGDVGCNDGQQVGKTVLVVEGGMAQVDWI